MAKTIDGKSKFLGSLRKAHGMIDIACELVGVKKKTVIKWIREDDTFRDEVIRTRSKRDKKKAVLLGLRVYRGLVSMVCDKAGVSGKEFKGWLKEDSDFAEKVDDILRVQDEKTAMRLMEKIWDGNAQSMIYYLKTKGKKIGFGAENARDGSGNDDVLDRRPVIRFTDIDG